MNWGQEPEYNHIPCERWWKKMGVSDKTEKSMELNIEKEISIMRQKKWGQNMR